MNFNEADQAIKEANDTLNKGDYMIRTLASQMIGRLRSSGIRSGLLSALKRELSDYNIKTGEWKN